MADKNNFRSRDARGLFSHEILFISYFFLPTWNFVALLNPWKVLMYLLIKLQFSILHANLKISGKSRRPGGEVVSALKRRRSPVSKSLNCKNDGFVQRQRESISHKSILLCRSVSRSVGHHLAFSNFSALFDALTFFPSPKFGMIFYIAIIHAFLNDQR